MRERRKMLLRKNESAWDRARPIVFAMRPELRPHMARVDFCAKYEIRWNMYYCTPQAIPGYNPLAADDFEYAFAASALRAAVFAERIIPHALANGVPWEDMHANLFPEIPDRIPLPSVDDHSAQVNGFMVTDMLVRCTALDTDAKRLARCAELRADAEILFNLFAQHRLPLCRTDAERWALNTTFAQRARVETCPEALREPFRRFFTAVPASDEIAKRWTNGSLMHLINKVSFLYQAYVLLEGRRIPLPGKTIAENPLRLTAETPSFPVPLQRVGASTYTPMVAGDAAFNMIFFLDNAPFMRNEAGVRPYSRDGAIQLWCEAMHGCAPGEITVTDDGGSLYIEVAAAFYARIIDEVRALNDALYEYAVAQAAV